MRGEAPQAWRAARLVMKRLTGRFGSASWSWGRAGPRSGSSAVRLPTASRGDRHLHQFDDLLLDRGAPPLERERHRPHVCVVQIGRVLEAQGRVAVFELARVLEEDDNLAGLVGVGGHPVPGLW